MYHTLLIKVSTITNSNLTIFINYQTNDIISLIKITKMSYYKREKKRYINELIKNWKNIHIFLLTFKKKKKKKN